MNEMRHLAEKMVISAKMRLFVERIVFWRRGFFRVKPQCMQARFAGQKDVRQGCSADQLVEGLLDVDTAQY